MNLFAIILFMSLTLKPLVVRSEFCAKYKAFVEIRAKEVGFPDKTDYAVKNLQFIATKDMLYLYLRNFGGLGSKDEEWVYEFDVSCQSYDSCPKIGSEQQLSQVFKDVTALKWTFIQNGFTYFFTEKSTKVYKFENKNKIKEIEEKDFWNDITHATVYEWKDNIKTVKSRFIPPKTPEGPPRYGFSYDTLNGTATVEVQGNYEMVNIVKHVQVVAANGSLPAVYLTLYSFGDYLVPTEFNGYLPLPHGDDIFNYVNKPFYVRKDGMSFLIHRTQDLYKLFGCDNSFVIPEKIMTDTRSDNIYPLYFKDSSSAPKPTDQSS